MYKGGSGNSQAGPKHHGGGSGTQIAPRIAHVCAARRPSTKYRSIFDVGRALSDKVGIAAKKACWQETGVVRMWESTI
jgi:hypothetical protein